MEEKLPTSTGFAPNSPPVSFGSMLHFEGENHDLKPHEKWEYVTIKMWIYNKWENNHMDPP